MAKFPYLTNRNGSTNLYYKRLVPTDLRAEGRPQQIWRSLGTSDRNKAKRTYATQHAEVELLFSSWRQEDNQSNAPATNAIGQPVPASRVVALTPALLRSLSDTHYLNIYESDFAWRGSLWLKAQQDERAFWQEEFARHWGDDFHELESKPLRFHGYWMKDLSLEEGCLYCIFTARKRRLEALQQQYRLGASQKYETSVEALLTSKGVALAPSDRPRLIRKLMETEIRALEDLSTADDSKFDQIVAQAAGEAAVQPAITQSKPATLTMSELLEKYLSTSERERQWPKKTVLRQRAAMQEFIEIVGNRPVNTYTQTDGVHFKDVQFALPNNRQKAPFQGLSLKKAAEKTKHLRAQGAPVQLLNPVTIKDKIGAISLFFVWAQSRDQSVVNPLANQQLRVARKKTFGKKRHPWTIEELNRMFAAPIYTGCRSEYFWKQPGPHVLRQSAMFWVPLIALFSGMRLGEIIQLQVADVKTIDNIMYFDVTPIAPDPSNEKAEESDETNQKSLKTSTSRRGIPIHKILLGIGFEDFLEYRRKSKGVRLFTDYEKAIDDGSWSKQFSKHFRRFRISIGVVRMGITFHSFRHNVEDALRNSSISQELRDAVQGHGENGVSREYGTGFYVKTLNNAVQAISYNGLNLSHLYPASEIREITNCLSETNFLAQLPHSTS